MGMWQSSAFGSASLNWLKDNSQVIAVNSTRPLTSVEALNSSNYCLAKSTDVGSSNFTDVSTSASGSGYQIATTQWANLAVISSGVGDHVSFINASSSKVLYVVTCAAQSMTTADVVTVSTWAIRLRTQTSD